MGPDRHICGRDRRITHANSYATATATPTATPQLRQQQLRRQQLLLQPQRRQQQQLQPRLLSNRNRYIYANDEPYAYSYWHSYAETYSHSKSSSDHSASSDTAAETVAIFASATFFAIGNGSVLTGLAPARVYAAASRRCAVVSRCPIARGRASQEMRQNCVDTFDP